MAGLVLINQVWRSDPTHTVVLRRRFQDDMRRRFTKVQRAVAKLIVDEDCFGLLPAHRVVTNVGQYAYPLDADKISAFMAWLQEQVDNEILQIVAAPQIGVGLHPAFTNLYVQSWMNTYINLAYLKGIQRADQELRKAGYRVPEEMFPVLAPFLNPFGGPVHLDRVGALYLRNFSELKGLTAQMVEQMRAELALGMAQGGNPLDIAIRLRRVLGISRRRAETIARTEIIRAHHMGNIQEYRNAGVLGIRVMAEWSTAGDDRVCASCASLEGRVFTLDEIEPMIPRHPSCRCCATPVDVTDR